MSGAAVACGTRVRQVVRQLEGERLQSAPVREVFLRGSIRAVLPHRFVLAAFAYSSLYPRLPSLQSTKIYRTIKAHDAVCIGAEWHPLESSKVATCSWDGTIKYWD